MLSSLAGLPRKLRLQFDGAICNVTNCGDRNEMILLDDPDRQRFVETLSEVRKKTGWQAHAYCRMGNPFQLVIGVESGCRFAGCGAWDNRISGMTLGTDWRHEGGAASWRRLRESNERKTRGLMEEMLGKFEWTEKNLGRRPNGAG